MKKLLYLLIMVLTLSSCGNKSTRSHKDIMVSIEPLRFFVEQIAGDKHSVGTLVPNGSSPETYEPTPQDMITISESRAFITFGTLQNEIIWTERIKAEKTKAKTFTVADSLNNIRESNGEFDPHVWTSTHNAKIIASNVCNVLCQTDSANADYYRSNLEKLNKRIDETDKAIHTLLDGSIHRTFVIYHPALTYFAHEYGLIQIPIEENGKEPTADLIKNLIVRSRDEKVKAILIQKEFNQRNAETISKETGAKIKVINPLSYDWNKEMIETAKKLK